MPDIKRSQAISSSSQGGKNRAQSDDSNRTQHFQLKKKHCKKRKITDDCRDNDNNFDGLHDKSNENREEEVLKAYSNPPAGRSANIIITKEIRPAVPEVVTLEDARLKEEVLQIDQDVTKGKDKILESTIEVINNLFNGADPDFLQEKINACMTLGNDEKELSLYIEELLKIKKFPTMKDYMKRMDAMAKNSDNENFEEEGHHGMCHCVVNCSICLEDVSYTEMGRCNSMRNEHIFCLHCIRNYTAAEVEHGRATFKCMDSGCSAEFSLKILRKVMNRSTLARVCEQRQHEKVLRAKIENLELCPFCNYKAIVTNKEDKIFACMNPRCMKNSCRLCKKEDHIPLRCNEVKTNVAEEARKKLENKMSEAIIRCHQQRNQDKIHQEELRRAAIEGKLEMDPNIKLTHDPTIGIL
ncbi:uncharacterized protein [Palaemon carinicauda]|uniref:uncharacterized protein isoform X2 n=1 Tax=Palaemon carinicauda TaxID=392227 RepID=UPI0035B5C983